MDSVAVSVENILIRQRRGNERKEDGRKGEKWAMKRI